MKKGPEMKDEYDFRGGRRGAVLPVAPGKERITIRLDAEIIAWFKQQVHEAGGNYQTLINQALLEHMARKREPLEETLRRVLREELSGEPNTARRRKRVTAKR